MLIDKYGRKYSRLKEYLTDCTCKNAGRDGILLSRGGKAYFTESTGNFAVSAKNCGLFLNCCNQYELSRARVGRGEMRSFAQYDSAHGIS